MQWVKVIRSGDPHPVQWDGRVHDYVIARLIPTNPIETVWTLILTGPDDVHSDHTLTDMDVGNAQQSAKQMLIGLGWGL